MFRLLFPHSFYLTTVPSSDTIADSIFSKLIPFSDLAPILAIVSLRIFSLSRALLAPFFHHYVRILRLFRRKCTVSLTLALVLAHLLISHAQSPFFAFASALSRLERSFCTFHTTSPNSLLQ